MQYLLSKNVPRIRHSATVLLLFVFIAPALMVPVQAFAQTPKPIELATSPEMKAQAAEAEKTLTPGTRGSLGTTPPASYFPCTWTDPPCWVLASINFLLDALFYLPTKLAAKFFEWSIESNMGHQNATDPLLIATNAGYPLVLAVANMFFVLILLWTAIATIFDFEAWSARQLLPKLIIAALLINFSLPIGRSIINLSNGIGDVFYKNLIVMGGGSITGVVTGMFQYEIIQQAWLKNPYAEKCKNLQSDQCYDLIAKDLKVMSADGTTELDAKKCEPVSGPAVAPIVNPFGIGLDPKCADLRVQLSQRLEQAKGEGGTTQLAGMVTAKIFIFPILIFVLFAGQGFLMTRMITLSFLLVLAPLAFLFFILPATRNLWTKWWENLFKWSFFLPSFLFFLWLSFAIIKRLRLAIPKAYTALENGVPTLDFIGALTLYFFAAAFMLGSLMMANYFGIAGASSMINLGKKAAGGAGRLVGKGALYPVRAVGRRALSKAGEFAHGIEGGKFQDTRLARGLMKVPLMRRGFQNLVSTARNRIDESEKKFEHLSSKEIARRMKLFGTSKTDKAGMSEVLFIRRDTDDLIDNKTEATVEGMKRGKRINETTGEEEDFTESQKRFNYRKNQAMIEARNQQVDPVIVEAAKFSQSVGVDIAGFRRSMPHLSGQFSKDGSEDGTYRAQRGEHAPRYEPHEMYRKETVLSMFRNATSGWIKALEQRGGTGATILKSVFDGTYAGVDDGEYPQFRQDLLRALAKNTGVLRTLASKTTPGGLDLKLTDIDKDFLEESVRETPDEQVVREIVRPERTERGGGGRDETDRSPGGRGRARYAGEEEPPTTPSTPPPTPPSSPPSASVNP